MKLEPNDIRVRRPFNNHYFDKSFLEIIKGILQEKGIDQNAFISLAYKYTEENAKKPLLDQYFMSLDTIVKLMRNDGLFDDGKGYERQLEIMEKAIKDSSGQENYMKYFLPDALKNYFNLSVQRIVAKWLSKILFGNYSHIYSLLPAKENN